MDYHPVENRRVFVVRASPTAETDEIAPNHWTSADLFSAAVYKRAYFCDRTDCCFPSRIYCSLVCATALAILPLLERIIVTADATECFSITASARKDLSFSRSYGYIWHPIFA